MGRLIARRSRAGAAAVAASCALAAAVPTARLASAAPEGGSLLRNGTFLAGSGGVPEGWRTEAWSAQLSEFTWTTEGGEGTISIVSPKPNDARWCQAVAVEPGATYRIAARVKTADVGMTTAGALVAIEPRVADTADLRGTNDWRTIEVVAQAGDDATTWDVCPRLGSYASLNTGTAWFRDVTVTRVGAPPPRPGWLSQALASLRPTSAPSWSTVAVPLGAGVLLAFGLGIFRRRH